MARAPYGAFPPGGSRPASAASPRSIRRVEHDDADGDGGVAVAVFGGCGDAEGRARAYARFLRAQLAGLTVLVTIYCGLNCNTAVKREVEYFSCGAGRIACQECGDSGVWAFMEPEIPAAPCVDGKGTGKMLLSVWGSRKGRPIAGAVPCRIIRFISSAANSCARISAPYHAK